MVTFASLFLGLVVGVQSISVLVGADVATVEILLDGESLGTLRGEPWTLEHDFGGDLVPHELLAVARDAEGGELGRARQWLNLPREPAEASLMVEEEGDAKVARLTWESVEGAAPSRLTVAFDGLPLEVRNPAHIELPPHSDEQLHFLRAELEFSKNVSTVVEATWGGFYADQVNTQLTGLPIQVGERPLPPLAEMQDWVTDGEQLLRVVAVEEGPAEVLLVRDLSAYQVAIARAKGLFSLGAQRRYVMSLRGDVRVRYVWPYAEQQGGRWQTYMLFPSSADFTMHDGGMLWRVYAQRQPTYPRSEERVSLAVAVAAMNATARNRRRAVVLIVGPEMADRSFLSPEQVRGYLEALHVPFFVWSLLVPSAELERTWGPVTDVSSLKKLNAAVKRLEALLEDQRILWVDGVHLPQRLRLTAAAGAVRVTAEQPPEDPSSSALEGVREDGPPLRWPGPHGGGRRGPAAAVAADR